jgi:hypothetical protein
VIHIKPPGEPSFSPGGIKQGRKEQMIENTFSTYCATTKIFSNYGISSEGYRFTKVCRKNNKYQIFSECVQ